MPITLCSDTKKDLAHVIFTDSGSFDSLIGLSQMFGQAQIYAEYRDPNKNSHKFYRVSVKNSHYTVSWGRVGTKGTSQDVTLFEAKKRWNSKLGKGYEKNPNPFAGTPLSKAREIRRVGVNSYQVFCALDHSSIVPLCKVPRQSVIQLLQSA